MREETKNVFDVVLGSLQLLALVISGLWVYFRFRREGTDSPRIEFGVDCRFLGPVEGEYVAAFEVQGNNRGQVEHRFSEIRLKVLGIKVGETLKEFEGHAPRLAFPTQLIRGENLVPEKFGYFFVRPGVCQTFSYVTKISTEFRFVIARVTFKYENTEDLHTAEKVFELKPLIDNTTSISPAVTS